MDMAEQKRLVFTSENISIVIPNEFMKMLEIAWKIKEKWAFLWNGNGMKKVIYKYKWWWKMTYIYDWEFIENGWWKIIYKYDWDLKMTYENKWEWKANYKYKWDNFLDYDMKNHDIHENKNVCPEFNGEKMHEQHLPCGKCN